MNEESSSTNTNRIDEVKIMNFAQALADCVGNVDVHWSID
ncbi:unnamed protein product [Arabidopsis halleri]